MRIQTFIRAGMMAWGLMLLSACGSSNTSTVGTACTGGDSSTGTTAGTGTSANTSGVLCSYATRVFNSSASVNACAVVQWSCSGTRRTVTGNGLPDHSVGSFPNNGNPETMAAQNVSASGRLSPIWTNAKTAVSGPGVPMGYALNGIKIDPATAGTCNDAGTSCPLGPGGGGSWNIEAMGQTAFNFGTDSNNAHVQPGGAYHYHGVPEGLVTKLNKGQAMTLIAWAPDGFPIYARYGYTTANDATSPIKVMVSSYTLKTTPDANRPATNLYAMGTFTQDYQYALGADGLDECNGRTGVTPEFPNGIYHYYATDTYPFFQRCVKGQL